MGEEAGGGRGKQGARAFAGNFTAGGLPAKFSLTVRVGNELTEKEGNERIRDRRDHMHAACADRATALIALPGCRPGRLGAPQYARTP